MEVLGVFAAIVALLLVALARWHRRAPAAPTPRAYAYTAAFEGDWPGKYVGPRPRARRARELPGEPVMDFLTWLEARHAKPVEVEPYPIPVGRQSKTPESEG